MENTEMKRKPVKSFYERGINVAVWDRQNDYTFTVRKTYKNVNGEYVTTSTLFPEDLVILQKLVGMAIEFRRETLELLHTASEAQPKIVGKK